MEESEMLPIEILEMYKHKERRPSSTTWLDV